MSSPEHQNLHVTGKWPKAGSLHTEGQESTDHTACNGFLREWPTLSMPSLGPQALKTQTHAPAKTASHLNWKLQGFTYRMLVRGATHSLAPCSQVRMLSEAIGLVQIPVGSLFRRILTTSGQLRCVLGRTIVAAVTGFWVLVSPSTVWRMDRGLYICHMPNSGFNHMFVGQGVTPQPWHITSPKAL